MVLTGAGAWRWPSSHSCDTGSIIPRNQKIESGRRDLANTVNFLRSVILLQMSKTDAGIWRWLPSCSDDARGLIRENHEIESFDAD